METYELYATLIKPDWAPPAYVFGPVWVFLYALIAISFTTVFYRVITESLPTKVALPFALNLVFNALFPTLQFGLENNTLAAIDILLVLATLIWAIIEIYPRIRWIAYMQIPYLLWVSFATVLQLTITKLN